MVVQDALKKLDTVYSNYVSVSDKEKKMQLVSKIINEFKDSNIIGDPSIYWIEKEAIAIAKDLIINAEIELKLKELTKYLGFRYVASYIVVESPCIEYEAIENSKAKGIGARVLSIDEDIGIEWVRLDLEQNSCVKIISYVRDLDP